MKKTKTELIFELNCPYDNPYQGKDLRYLFVCSAGLLRSPTAANVALDLGYNTRSCGSAFNYALIPISVNLVHWAHMIFFMNSDNYHEALINLFENEEAYKMLKNKAVIWDIEDDYEYNDLDLRSKVRKLLT